MSLDGELRDDLLFALVEEAEVLLTKIADGAAFAVPDDDRDGNHIHAAAECSRCLCRCDLRLLGGEYNRVEQQAENQSRNHCSVRSFQHTSWHQGRLQLSTGMTEEGRTVIRE
jgi:hypothetical protein